MIYKWEINGCMGFKMGKELKSMPVVIVIPMGFEMILGDFAKGDGFAVYECDGTPVVAEGHFGTASEMNGEQGRAASRGWRWGAIGERDFELRRARF